MKAVPIESVSKMLGHKSLRTTQIYTFTLGGLGDYSLVHSIISEIQANLAFHDQEEKFIKCAEDCFKAGYLKPFGSLKKGP